MTQRPIVLLLIPHLGGGGAERVVELLAQNLNTEKYELHLGLITGISTAPARIPPHVVLHCLGCRRVRTATLPLLRLVRRVRPDVILSSMAHLNFLVLMLRLLFPTRTRVLVRQNGTVSSMLGDTPNARLTHMLYRILYPQADRVICQSQAMTDDMEFHIGICRDRLAVLQNPIEMPLGCIDLPGDSDKSKAGPSLFAAGRLSREKGMDLLVEAVALLLPQFPGLQLAVAGHGSQESALREQAARLGVDHAVHFLGYLDSLEPHMTNADLFVLPSRHEGMPNALLEAAASGLPIVATPACAGILNLLKGSPGAWLASEVSAPALAQAISRALATLLPGVRFRHEWLRPFRLEFSIAAYEDLIDSVCQRTAD